VRELVLHCYCDDCYDRDETKVEDPDGTVVHVDVPFRGMLRFDLCGQSDKQLAQPLRELLAGLPTVSVEKPQAAERPTVPAGELIDCPYCMYGSPRRNDMINHLWHVHTKSARTGKFAVPQKCPTCHAGPFGGNQGMSSHRSTIHGYDALAEALKATKAKGNFKWSHGYPERPGAVIPNG
jgi:hypothetical protein